MNGTAPDTALARVVECVRLRAIRLAGWFEAEWRLDESTGEGAIAAAEVARALLAPREVAAQRQRFYREDPDAQRLGGAIARADAARAADPVWARLVEAFELDALQADLLATATALHSRPALGRAFAWLQDDPLALAPGADLVTALFDHPPVDAPFDPGPLLEWRLALPEPQALPMASRWHVTPAVPATLAIGSWRDPLLATGAVIEREPSATAALPCLHPQALERALAALDRRQSVDVTGTPGSGRRTLCAQIGAARGQPVLLAEMPRLLAGAGDAGAALVAVLRWARFDDALACFVDAEALPPGALAALRGLGDAFLRCADAGTPPLPGALAIEAGPLDLAQRVTLWSALAPDRPLPPSLATHRRTAGAVAALVDDSAPPPVAPPELLAALPLPYGWDDLILPSETRATLRGFVDQVELRAEVLVDWGFDRLNHLGNGLLALFAGPSGVGKTMAAQVVARELGLRLLRIDLAGVVDKFIGETEKRLRDAFAFAEQPGVLLFFDEADALFGARTQVRDSHDRYANLEINYLLQRIESFEGVCILATNRKNDLDTAFRRRIATMVDFLPPGPAEREKLWRIALPPCSPKDEPITEEIDFALLAARLNMTGADIKAAALAAAFLARKDGGRIAMRHVLAAAQREGAKHGQSPRMPVVEAAR